MYFYIYSMLTLGVVWLWVYSRRDDLKKLMVWGGVAYIILMVSTFFVLWLASLFINVNRLIIPLYWNPPTLFNMGWVTGGVGVEDIMFMFFFGSCSAVIYEELLNKKVKKKRTKHHAVALAAFLPLTVLFSIIFNFNPLYNYLFPAFISSAIILFQRHDLIRHTLYGALIATALYFALFLFFNAVFPTAVSDYWSLKNLSGIMLLGIPAEELLYAFSHGLMWVSIYEYFNGNMVDNRL
ncbi:hypothetical protein HYY72_04990 [Candidatus Woesearchaeota archaeon]|nr:hypothetical protein [Candidatus Woesearchaeota archaeon]